MTYEQPVPRKLVVLANSTGALLAAYVPQPREQDAPMLIELVAAEGQVVRTVELPTELARDGVGSEVLQQYRLDVDGDVAELIRANGASGA